jgi:F420 biosynthesis protein FbiB-like protein
MSADFRRDLIADGIPADEAEARVHRSIQRIREAPVAIILCLDLSDLDAYPDTRRQEAERLMAVQSTALSGGNLLLAAHAEGLGGVWVCAPLFAPETIQRTLELPGKWQPQALLLIGYPARLPNQRQRRPLGEVVRYYG